MIHSDFPTRQPAPKIGENGNWWEWDELTQAYVDTGRPSRGEDGAAWVLPDGTPGQVLTKTADGAAFQDSGLDMVKDGGFYEVAAAHTDGKYILNYSPGTAMDQSGWKCTDFIPIRATAAGRLLVTLTDASGAFVEDGSSYNGWYDAEKNWIAQLKVTNQTLNVPANAAFVRLSCRSQYVQKLYLYSFGVKDLGKAVSMIAETEAEMIATKNYVAGELVIVQGALYKVTAPIASGGAITSGVNATPTTVEAQIAASGGGGGSVTVDSALSASSMNPVQNKVVKTALDSKITAPADPVSGQFLVYNGTAWVAQTLTAWQGGSY